MSQFEGRPSREESPIETGTPVTKGSIGKAIRLPLGGTIKELTAFCKKKVPPAVVECEAIEVKDHKSIEKKKRVVMDDSTWYANFTNSDGSSVGPFRVRDEAVPIDVFKVALFVFSSTLARSYKVALYGKVSITKNSIECMLPSGQIFGCQKQLSASMYVTRMARKQEWNKLHFDDLKTCE
ncbi:hypothetical protein PanWU01x14_266280 [Parasponia andersonii]|uniref:Uncharacterized protein n=1 Tax=Parasponia andersonii TaxID=3476 RepID=A0A2P5B6W4_PARAD|nr:hypothetical protein PanWU01x14_266280 [Parasponia andersonii]